MEEVSRKELQAVAAAATQMQIAVLWGMINAGVVDRTKMRELWRDNQDERGATIKMRRSGRMVNDCRWPRVLQAD